jgi:hypothetical protein
MKCCLFFILPWFLAACAAPAAPAPKAPTESAFDRTKLFALTAEVETQTSRYPANDATITAIMANKYALGTAMAATMTAQLSETPLPTVPPDAPFCHPADLKSSFGSNAATQEILLSGGLTNSSASPCFLQAWPQVLLVDRQGRPLDVDYGYFDIGIGNVGSVATQRAQEYATAKVGLWPGWSVWINLIWQNCYGAPISGSVVIRLTFNNTGVINIPTDIQGGRGTCNPPGQRSTVGIAKLVLMPPQ